MYSVLIVEDEYYVRSSLIHRIEWDKLNLCVAGEADNGVKALEFLQHTHVDILLTDIRMPEMDGLELISAAKALSSQIRCVILSGYDDFVYTKAAIRLGVSDYIQKPIDEEEVSETLRRIADELDRESRSDCEDVPRNAQLIRQLAQQKMHRQLERLLVGQESDFKALPQEQYAVAAIYVGNVYEQNKIERWLESVSLGKMRVFGDLQSDYVMHIRLLICGQDLTIKRLEEFGAQLHAGLQNVVGTSSVRCGISNPAENTSGIAAAYQQALTALKSKMLWSEPVLLFARLPAQNMEELNAGIRTAFELRDALSQRNKKSVQLQVGMLFSTVFQHVDSIQTILRYIGDIVHEYIVCYHVEGGELISILTEPNALLVFESLDDLRTTLVPMILDFFFFNKHFLDDRIVGRVQLYIRQHLRDDLKVSTLGQIFFLSPNYLSFLFKKETSYTLSEYVENARMEHACVLLSMEYSIVEVAMQVGYSDAAYFSRVFKKRTGMSPQKYQHEYKMTPR